MVRPSSGRGQVLSIHAQRVQYELAHAGQASIRRRPHVLFKLAPNPVAAGQACGDQRGRAAGERVQHDTSQWAEALD
jgi:hypothetical protein